MTLKFFAPTVLMLSALALSACSNSREVSQNEYFSSAKESGAAQAPGLLGDGGLSFGLGSKRADKQDGQDNSGIGVNAYLWRATLDTLSFMPLVSADPMGGVIITDWWQTGSTPRERFKATAYIMTRRLRSDGVKVSLFHQVDQSGQWVDAGVAATTTGELEDKILARAREMRAPLAQN